MKRLPAVAGKFYLGGAQQLAAHVAELSGPEGSRANVIGAVCPHAGLVYSGAIAGAVYARIMPPQTFILLGPNHTGRGKYISLMAEGSWSIPTGDVEIDTGLAMAIAQELPGIAVDAEAHRQEHSLEVQLPFILHNAPGARIVPIAIMHASLEELLAIGRGIARSVSACGYPVVIIASTDMSHFMSDAEARIVDHIAIQRMLARDPGGLYATVRNNDISMCGVLPTTVMIEASNTLGATRAELVAYDTSAALSRDYGRVVGYAGMLFS